MMSKLDEVERQRLAEAVWQMEQVIHGNSASAGGAVTSMLVAFVEGAKQRIAVLDAEITVEAELKKEREERLQAAALDLVGRETALNQHEREQYAGFLSCEFFNKRDFGALENFYTSAWDRLSEGGKAQMSHRVWEGVRREEYEFSELPEVVKEKEAKRLHDMMVRRESVDSNLEAIPAKDRADFLSAWEKGKHKEAYQVLDRPSFAESVAVSAVGMKSAQGVAATIKEAEAGKTAEASSADLGRKDDVARLMGSVDFGALDIQLGSEEAKNAKPPTQIKSIEASNSDLVSR